MFHFALPLMLAAAQPAVSPQAPTHVIEVRAPEILTGKVKGNKVRLRLAPDLDGKIVGELNCDDLLLVSGERNGFYMVDPPLGTKGYVFRAYVLDNVVEASNVNIRLEPSLEAPIVGKFNVGAHVEGSVAKENSKWLEIDLPKGTHFYVAKEYVEMVGKKEVFDTAQRRRREVAELMSGAYALAKEELQKPFEEIDLAPVHTSLNRIINQYGEFKEQRAKAKELLTFVQEAYLQSKVAYLEGKQHTAQLDAQEFENSLALETVATLEQSPWQLVEDHLFTNWARVHEDATQADFYLAQMPFAATLEGTVEAYQLNVKNRPGDYLLKIEGAPVAFLYSTSINLADKVGKKVRVKGLPRSSHHFAYPAYFAIEAQ